MRTKFSPLHLYKSSFQRQVTILTQKIFLLAYIKATVKAFWWGALLKFPHLIATRMAFWLGVFSKIQSMFTNSLSPNSLGNNQNLRQGGIKCFCLHLYKSKISIKTYTFEISCFKKYESSYLCKSCFFIKSTRSNRKIHKLFSYSHLLITCHLAFQFERLCHI